MSIKSKFQKHSRFIYKNLAILSIPSILFMFYMFFVTIQDVNHYSIKRNYFTGDVQLDTVPGIKISSPWTQVIRIDNRPFKICVTSSSKVLNCGVYSFNPKGFEGFIKREGVEYYWWRNRLSFNLGHKEEYRGFVDILKGYTLDKDRYEFITYK